MCPNCKDTWYKGDTGKKTHAKLCLKPRAPQKKEPKPPKKQKGENGGASRVNKSAIARKENKKRSEAQYDQARRQLKELLPKTATPTVSPSISSQSHQTGAHAVSQ
jgi:hypothetical protein